MLQRLVQVGFQDPVVFGVVVQGTFVSRKHCQFSKIYILNPSYI